MSHPFIIDLKYAFKDEDKLYFAMPFIRGGDFFGLLKEFNFLSEERTKYYIAELVLAICKTIKKNLFIIKILYIETLNLKTF